MVSGQTPIDTYIYKLQFLVILVDMAAKIVDVGWF